MKKKGRARSGNEDRETMRPQYDFAGGKRGLTAARYGEGANVVVIDPDLLDVFPDSRAVNEILRALAPVVRNRRRTPRRRRLA